MLHNIEIKSVYKQENHENVHVEIQHCVSSISNEYEMYRSLEIYLYPEFYTENNSQSLYEYDGGGVGDSHELLNPRTVNTVN